MKFGLLIYILTNLTSSEINEYISF
jgi:hypothetical protein